MVEFIRPPQSPKMSPIPDNVVVQLVHIAKKIVDFHINEPIEHPQ